MLRVISRVGWRGKMDVGGADRGSPEKIWVNPGGVEAFCWV
jgi:hypothetical protein